MIHRNAWCDLDLRQTISGPPMKSFYNAAFIDLHQTMRTLRRISLLQDIGAPGMRVTLSVIQADIGSIGGHICPSRALLKAVVTHVAENGRRLLRDTGIMEKPKRLGRRFAVRPE
jgi:hypothetical protein